MSDRVRSRFAMDPTGELDVGDARVALVAWAVARGADGTFVLRVDDTDAPVDEARSAARTLADLRWLGVEWDEGTDVGGPHAPYVQSERSQRHREVAAELLRTGAAYRCFCTPETLARQRDLARRAGRPTRYEGTCAELPGEESARRAAAGEPFAVRLRLREGNVWFRDLVRGDVAEQPADGDFILARADGAPVYDLACVTDDHDMGITHVVRSHDRLPGTVRQLAIAAALRWTPPAYAHLGMLADSEERRSAVGRGGTTVAELRTAGYSGEAVANFLALTCRCPGEAAQDDVLAPAELVRCLALADCSAEDGAVDLARLRRLGNRHLGRLTAEELVRRTLAWVAAGDPVASMRAAGEEWAAAAMLASRESASTLDEVWEPVAALLGDAAPPESYGGTVEEQRAARERLESVAGQLERLPLWGREVLQAALPAEALPLVRLAVTGRRSGPELAALLAALGQAAAVERIRGAVESLEEEDWSGVP
jgi:nondiscriminating glutamyl-tRNA synthetase